MTVNSESWGEINPEEAAYVAGFFDGEGCVNFARGKSGQPHIRVLIVNTNRAVLEYIQRLFGGDINRTVRQDGWKQSWQLRVGWSRAIQLLEAIEPYVRVKADQVHLAFCWDHFRPGSGKMSSAEKAANADVNAYLCECLTYFNKRGIHDLEDPIARELAGTS